MVRMCIAEAGYDPDAIHPYPHPSVGFTFSVDQFAGIPTEVSWMARELAGVGDARCLACSDRDRRAHAPGPCEAERRFVRNCAAE